MNDQILKLFGEPPFHLLAMSGGKDSTALALEMKRRHPELRISHYCTPTGRELPEMFEWWKRLGDILGSRIIPIMEMSFNACVEQNQMLPNHQVRFCTRQIKIEPAIRLMRKLSAIGPVFHYVGLRADEEGRVGGVYDGIPNMENKFPMREWGWTLAEVKGALAENGIEVPRRTDCDICYHQRLGEWFQLWRDHPANFAEGVAMEEKFGHTFRSAQRDSWPAELKDLGELFASGKEPTISLKRMERESQAGGACRVCSL